MDTPRTIDEIIGFNYIRAGLPPSGLLNCLMTKIPWPKLEKHTEEEFDVEIEYMSSRLTGKTVLLSDPMLASGKSMVLAYKALLWKGVPKKIHVVSVIASQEGVDFVKNNLPEDTTIWIGAIDKEMTKESYIVPGLGDAGDLAFGIKKDD